MKQHNCPHLKILAIQQQAQEEMQALVVNARTQLSQSDAAARQAEAEKIAIADAAQQREQALRAQLSESAAAAQQRAEQAEARAVEIANAAEMHHAHQEAAIAQKDKDISALQRGAEQMVSSSNRHFCSDGERKGRRRENST